eukprot:8133-Chlamydomonas_euryale.AAC.1
MDSPPSPARQRAEALLNELVLPNRIARWQIGRRKVEVVASPPYSNIDQSPVGRHDFGPNDLQALRASEVAPHHDGSPSMAVSADPCRRPKPLEAMADAHRPQPRRGASLHLAALHLALAGDVRFLDEHDVPPQLSEPEVQQLLQLAVARAARDARYVVRGNAQAGGPAVPCAKTRACAVVKHHVAGWQRCRRLQAVGGLPQQLSCKQKPRPPSPRV